MEVIVLTKLLQSFFNLTVPYYIYIVIKIYHEVNPYMFLKTLFLLLAHFTFGDTVNKETDYWP